MNVPEKIPVLMPGTQRLLMPVIRQDGKGNNDFCVVQDDNRIWHIFSITWFGAHEHPEPRCCLSHATAPDLLGPWTRQDYIKLTDSNNWAPHIVRDPYRPEMFLMYIGGMPKDTLRCYESHGTDLFHWTLRRDYGWELGTRDPMILYVEAERRYYMYTTYTTQTDSNVGIAISVSEDLDKWELLRIIPVAPGEVLDESPFVVYRDGWYYMWATWSSRSFYLGTPTRIFASRDPLFPEIEHTGEAFACASWPVHAVEIVSHGGREYLCQTGTGGPGIVATEMSWVPNGEKKTISGDKLNYQGIWRFDGHEWFSTQAGSGFVYQFSGRRAEIWGSLAMDGGICEIFIDGVSMGKVSQYACDSEFFTEVYRDGFLWSSPLLEHADHKIEVVVTGEKGPLATGCRIRVGKLSVYD